MHPEIARTLIAQHHAKITQQVATSRRVHRRPPRLRVNWSRTTLVPAGCAGGHGRSWVIVISASRTA
jgi:hypothetical protein